MAAKYIYKRGACPPCANHSIHCVTLQNEEIKVYKEKSLVTNVRENSIGYGILIYEGRIGDDRILFTAEDVY